MDMRTVSPAKWIEQACKGDSLRAKSLVMTIFGDSIAPHGGTVWLGSLIELLAPLGVNDRLVRTSIFRLAEEGWLESERSGRRSSYAITADALKQFGKAYRRVYAPLEPVWDGYWILLFAPSSDVAPSKRSPLRKELLWEGFGMLSPGVYASPVVEESVVHEMLQRFGLQDQLFVVKAKDLPGTGGKSLSAAVEEAWPLKEVREGYKRFITQFAPLAHSLAGRDVAPEQAFVIRTLLIHEFRRVQLHDPKLPAELLPSAWPGKEAYALCSEIYRRTYAAAEEYLLAALRREDDSAAEAAPYFYERFGGLR
jgi:phenylacetic acid degradation operon negative regulatory protein